MRGTTMRSQQSSRMVHIKDELSLKTLHGAVSVTLLLITCFCGGQSQQIDRPQSVIVMSGVDTVLPCRLKHPEDAFSMTVEWGRPDLDPRFVYVWHDGLELQIDQNKAYRGRTSLSVNKLQQGDLSLTLSKVKISDNGTYRCYIPKLPEEYFVELLVGAVSSPGISLAGIHKDSRGVMLDCTSEGWYPEPEVLWLDGEGNLLSAGPAETVRGPDDLYTVSSRVTVEKRHSNRFTCRVQQKNINQTREAHIYVPEDFFMAPSSCTAAVVSSVLFGFMFILSVVLFVWKWRQNKLETKNKKRDREGGEISQELQALMEKERFHEELTKKEEEMEDLTKSIDALKDVFNELKNQREKLTIQKKKEEKLTEETKMKIYSVDKEITEKNRDKGDKTVNKAQGYLKLKEIMSEVSWSLDGRKKEHQELELITEQLMKKIFDEVHKFTEKKEEVEKHMKQIKEEIQTTEREIEEIQEKTSDKKGKNRRKKPT